MCFDGQLFYKIRHKTARAFLPKAIRWTERDLNPRFFDCESNVRTKLNHQPLS
jgi:hypothetical protein